MRKSILTLGIAAVLTGVLATCSMAYAADDELAQIQESGKLKVGVEGTYPPYTYHDDNGELTGFDVEVAKAIADKLGVEADFTESDWDSLLAGIDSGRLDTVINAVSITPEREEKYDFAGPYFYITQQIVVAKDNDDIVDMASLDGKKIANTATTAYLDILEDAGASLVQISTRALQAAQLMPVTLYCSIINSSFEYSVSIPTDCSAHSYLRRQVHIRNALVSHFISFCKVATSSSMVSSLPSRISLATQVRI